MKLVPTLDSLAAELTDEFKQINWGGCCWVAGIMGHHLNLIPGVTNVRATVINNHELKNNTDDIRGNVSCNNVEDWRSNGMEFNHVLLRFTWRGRDYWYDTDYGCFKDLGETEYRAYIESGDLYVNEAYDLGMDDSPGAWNRAFDRDQIPFMEDRIYHKMKSIGVTAL